MEFDDLLIQVGEFGRYQRWVYFALCLAAIPAAFNNLAIVFLAGVPDHWCSVPSLDKFNLSHEARMNLSIPKETRDGASVYSQCEMYDVDFSNLTTSGIQVLMRNRNGSNFPTRGCESWTYDHSQYTSTITDQWNLVCNDKWLRATASSVYMAGLMVGVLVFGSISDLIGRRYALLISIFGMVAFSISTAFSPSYIVFVVLRFFTATFTISTFTTAYVLGMEIVGPSWRVFAGIVIEYFWAGGSMLIAGVAYGVRDWFTLQLVLSVPMAIFIASICIIPESPRWLYVQERPDDARVIMEKLASVNKVALPAKMDITVKKDDIGRKANIVDLVRTPNLRKKSLNIFFNWFVNSLVYYGLSLNTSNLGGDVYINFLISSAVEFPAYILVHLSVGRLGRRLPLSGCMLVGGIALLCTLAVPKELNWLSITLAMVGKFGISASFAIIYIFTAELFPTVVRNVGLGSSSLFARIGGILAPYIAILADYGKFIPIIIFGVFSLLAGLLALLLPETMGKNLPETIQDGEEFGRKTKRPESEAPRVNGTSNPAFSGI